MRAALRDEEEMRRREDSSGRKKGEKVADHGLSPPWYGMVMQSEILTYRSPPPSSLPIAYLSIDRK
jgi:hypothetical protein